MNFIISMKLFPTFFQKHLAKFAPILYNVS